MKLEFKAFFIFPLKKFITHSTILLTGNKLKTPIITLTHVKIDIVILLHHIGSGLYNFSGTEALEL